MVSSKIWAAVQVEAVSDPRLGPALGRSPGRDRDAAPADTALASQALSMLGVSRALLSDQLIPVTAN